MFTPQNPAYQTRIEQIFADAAFIQQLGIQLQDVGPGWCETRLPVDQRHLQQDSFVHAGVQATIADHTAGAAAGSLMAPSEIVLTVEFKINLLRPALGQQLLCRAEVLRAGRRLTIAESWVYARIDDSSKLVAKATVTLALVTL